MQRTEPEGIVLLCDFCRRDWDGSEPMIEGHHGSLLCLECLKAALRDQSAGVDRYQCTLCLRFNIPPTLPRWSNPAHPEAVACQECMHQAARALAKSKTVDFAWDPSA